MRRTGPLVVDRESECVFTPSLHTEHAHQNQIATAKSAIYTLIGGVDPAKTLSVTLDVGTTNDELLNDRLYVGWRQPRVRGQEYDNFVDRFVQLVRKHHPHCLLHFEDFGVTNAERLLDKYRDSHAVFNDDVQGTGAVTLACIMSAVGVLNSKLADQRFVIFGAGSAGLGIARQLRDGIVSIDGVDRDVANGKFYLLDKHGLLKQSLGPENIRDDVSEFVRPDAEWPEAEEREVGLLEVIRRVRPTVLIGCSTRAGAFSQDVVRAMAEGTPRPIILPLSNPSKLHEVTPQDAMDWTDGKALLATGSPFPPCRLPSGKEYIFPEGEGRVGGFDIVRRPAARPRAPEQFGNRSGARSSDALRRRGHGRHLLVGKGLEKQGADNIDINGVLTVVCGRPSFVSASRSATVSRPIRGFSVLRERGLLLTVPSPHNPRLANRGLFALPRLCSDAAPFPPYSLVAPDTRSLIPGLMRRPYDCARAHPQRHSDHA
uniref:Malic enzyme n=1 Tax=Ganoderma boninense TaxID=34458 RepID=A0A5K1K502_9APHY|nr:Thioredoxin 1 (Trx-1) [Ganoderma boninense]